MFLRQIVSASHKHFREQMPFQEAWHCVLTGSPALVWLSAAMHSEQLTLTGNACEVQLSQEQPLQPLICLHHLWNSPGQPQTIIPQSPEDWEVGNFCSCFHPTKPELDSSASYKGSGTTVRIIFLSALQLREEFSLNSSDSQPGDSTGIVLAKSLQQCKV